MIHLGASDKFKDAVFKLWVLYLQRNNIAFNKNDESEDQAPENKQLKLPILKKRYVPKENMQLCLLTFSKFVLSNMYARTHALFASCSPQGLGKE